MPRKILHIDMDAFFASIEQRDNPALRNKPVAVGGGQKRGVVAAASYEARKYGVHSAMPGFKARNACPDLIFVPPRFEIYRAVSQAIRDIFFNYTDLIEPIALDEAYLDVSTQAKDLYQAKDLAITIKRDIYNATRLNSSAGISYNKFLAKLASDMDKPNGIVLITEEDAEEILPAMEIRKFPGIGKVTAKRLNDLGIYRGKDLKDMGKLKLTRHFGKVGAYYYDIANGIDDRQVQTDRERKSVGVERTYRDDITSFELIREKLTILSGILYERLKRHGSWGYTLTLKIKSADFIVYNRQISVQNPFDTREQIEQMAFRLADDNRSILTTVRLLGLSVSNFQAGDKDTGGQLHFEFF